MDSTESRVGAQVFLGVSLLIAIAAVPALIGLSHATGPSVTGGTPAAGGSSTIAPVARCTLSATEIEIGESVTLDASASEDATAYRWNKYGEGEFGSYTDSATRTFTYDEPGTYEPQVEVLSPDETTDRASCGTLRVEENSPPTAEFTYSPSSPSPDEAVSFTADASDDDGEIVGYTWKIDGEQVGEGRVFEYTFTDPGEYFVELTVRDDDGATNTASATVVVESANEPPTVDVSYSPLEPTTDEQVTFTASATDEDGEVVGYEWRVDDEVVGEGPTLEYTFDEPGDHRVEATVTDDDEGTATAERTVTVVGDENQPPAVEIEYSPSELRPGEPVRFEAAAGDEDGEVVEYIWKVDGEVVGEGPTLEYTFDEPGDHRVEATVTDDDEGIATAERGIEVRESEPTDTTTPRGEVQLIAEWGYTPIDTAVGDRVTLFADGPHDPRVTYQWDFDDDGDFETEGLLVAHVFNETGAHAVTLEVVGPNGERKTETVTISVDEAQTGAGRDDELSIWTTPLDPRPGQRVTLVADPAVPPGQVETYRWDLDGDGDIDKRGRTVTHSFPEGGDRISVETVGSNDRVNRRSATVSTEGEAAPPDSSGPSLWMTPLNPRPGQRVTLVAESVVPPEKVEGYRWDLDGDGEPDTEGQTVIYSFPEDGRFAVSVSVRRTNGTSVTVENTIAVGNTTVQQTTDNGSADEQGTTDTATTVRSDESTEPGTETQTETEGAAGPGFDIAVALIAIALLVIIVRKRIEE